MDNTKAINILVSVARLAQKAGILSLEDAVVVKQAIEVVKPEEVKEEKVEEVKE